MKRRVVLLIVAVVAALAGCEEKDVFTVSQVEEIARYLDRVEEPLELFRTDNLIQPDTFVLPFDNSAKYVDIVDSVVRDSRDIRIAVTTGFNGGRLDTVGFNQVDLGFGTFPYADVIYLDDIHLTRRRLTSSDTSETSLRKRLRRRAFMIKLGDNSRPYSGWVMWGFDGGSAKVIDTATLTTDNGSVAADSPDTAFFDVYDASGARSTKSFGYTFLSNFAEAQPGGELEISTILNSSKIISLLANYQTDGGFAKTLLGTPSSARFYNLDTLNAPLAGQRIWHLMCFQLVVLDPGKITDSTVWCVPYRMEQ